MTSDIWSFRLTSPGTLTEVSVPGPDVDGLLEGQVLVRLEAGGLCGSDYSYFRGGNVDAVRMADPSSYASSLHGASLHEIVGVVVASRDDEVRVGERVVGWATEMNGLSEYVTTSGSSLAAYTADVPPRIAVMIQPLACVIYAVERMGSFVDSTVAVLGLGPIGLLFTHVLKSRGARQVIGVDRVDRGDVAKLFGVDEFVQASCDRWAAGLGDGERPTLVVEAIGHQISTLAVAIDAVAPMGEIYYFGVPDDAIYPISMTSLLRKDLTLRSGTTWDRRASLLKADAYVQSCPELVERYVTHVFARADAQAAYEAATRPTRGQLKVVIEV